MVAAAVAVVACTLSGTVLDHLMNQAGTPAVCVRGAVSGTSVLSGTPDALAADIAGSLLGCAPEVVVANASSQADVTTAVTVAEQDHAPLLLSSLLTTASSGGGPGTQQPQLTAAMGTAAVREISALHPRNVLAIGLTAGDLSAELPGSSVTAYPAGLPAMSRPALRKHVVVLVHAGQSPAAMAASATAEAVGATVVAVNGYDPRGDPAAIAALDAARPREVIAVGSGFGPESRLASRLGVVLTGVQLPGGGQLIVPTHRIVALYGCPGVPALGALGQQGPQASVTRAEQAAAPYRTLSTVPVVPAFEIIATVATAAPGADGGYSAQTPIAALTPWVRAATAAKMYVILDLQPGRDSFLAQAKEYESLLRLPNVGLALDPEWKLQPGQLPLQQIGSVSIAEVNSVVSWLGQLTAQYRLPQKLLVLHQFKIGEIANEQQLDTSSDNVAVVLDMDGQGAPAVKQQTWDAITSSAPPGVPFGWKNFYVKDQPMLTPSQTMAATPQPVMISYE
jgi:hypothetical protein